MVGSTLKAKEFAQTGANSCLYELTSIDKEAKLKMAELLPLEESPFTLIHVIQ